MLPLQQDYIFLRSSVFDKQYIWMGFLSQLASDLILINGHKVKTTVQSVLFIFSLALVLVCVSRDVERADVERKWPPSLSLCRPQCQRSTTLLWPLLLSKWQTVWQSQVVEIYHGDPSNKWHRAPPCRPVADRPQTSDSLSSAVFSPPLHSSSHHSALTSVLWAALLSADCPSSYLLYFPYRWGRLAVCAERVWSACLLTKSHVVKPQHFCSLTPHFDYFFSLSTIYQDLRIWKVNISSSVSQLNALECSPTCFWCMKQHMNE